MRDKLSTYNYSLYHSISAYRAKCHKKQMSKELTGKRRKVSMFINPVPQILTSTNIHSGHLSLKI